MTVSDGQCAISNDLTVAAACQLPVTALQATVNFAKPNADSCGLTTRLDLGAEFSVTNKAVVLNIAGAQVGFTLDKRGRGASQAHTCRLSYNKRNKLWTFKAKLRVSSWQTPWATHGLLNSSIPRPGVPVTLRVVLLVETEGFAADRQLTYIAKAGKSGSAK